MRVAPQDTMTSSPISTHSAIDIRPRPTKDLAPILRLAPDLSYATRHANLELAPTRMQFFDFAFILQKSTRLPESIRTDAYRHRVTTIAAAESAARITAASPCIVSLAHRSPPEGAP